MRRRRLWFAILALAGLGAGAAAFQDSSTEVTVRLRFPDGIDLTGLQIQYFLSGPFGGYGAPVQLDPGRRESVIHASHRGQLASTFQAIVWVPGYRYVLLPRSPIESQGLVRSIELEPLNRIPLSGEVILARPVKGLTIEAGYFSDWECDFFGFIDCLQAPHMVSKERIAVDGSFTLQIPDFARDPGLASFPRLGRLMLIIRDQVTLNPIYELEEVRTRGRRAEVPVASQYPQDLQLVVVPRR